MLGDTSDTGSPRYTHTCHNTHYLVPPLFFQKLSALYISHVIENCQIQPYLTVRFARTTNDSCAFNNVLSANYILHNYSVSCRSCMFRFAIHVFGLLTTFRQYLYFVPCMLRSGKEEEAILNKHNYYKPSPVTALVICFAFLFATSTQQEQLYLLR